LEVVRAGLGNGVTDLLELTRAADEGIGPYPDFYVGIGPA
jgi:hypothetical protein